jgi:hypothetical protein
LWLSPCVAALVEAARPSQSERVQASESWLMETKRAEAAGCLHLCMDPARNADHKWFREKVIARDGLTAFVALLKSGHRAGMEAAAWCLAHVAYEIGPPGCCPPRHPTHSALSGLPDITRHVIQRTLNARDCRTLPATSSNAL